MAGPANLYQTGDHASRPANGSGCVLYTCTTHGLVYRDDGTSWTTFLTLPSAGSTDAADINVADSGGNFTGTDVEAVLAELQANIDAVGGGTATFHGVRARQSADTPLTSGSVVYVAFDGADDYDTDAYHDPASSNTRLIVPTGLGGYYRINAASLITASPGASYCVIRKNGTTIVASGNVSNDNTAAAATVSTTLLLAQTDYVEFGIKVGAASKNSTGAGLVEPLFEMHLVGI